MMLIPNVFVNDGIIIYKIKNVKKKKKKKKKKNPYLPYLFF